MSTPSEVISAQIGENVRRLLRQVLGQTESPAVVTVTRAGLLLRPSKGLREFCAAIRSPEGLQILDLGAASQANINFLTGLGHRLCTEDLHRCLELFSARSMVSTDPDTETAQFFRENLQYQTAQFDGVLCWDLFDFLPDALLKPLVEKMFELVKPGGHLLTFFHSGQPGQLLPVCQYRIVSPDQLQINERAPGKLRRAINNRGIESLFRNYASLKFFLTKDSLREVVIVR
jgi:2-polyprenyl-3-methyl-5-hydroxy-6-metoxy-1,4-benzoquinol methylase